MKYELGVAGIEPRTMLSPRPPPHTHTGLLINFTTNYVLHKIQFHPKMIQFFVLTKVILQIFACCEYFKEILIGVA